MKRWLLLAIMALFCLIPFVIWAQTLGSQLPAAVYVYAIGRLLALLGFVFLFFQYVFSAKIKWIERGIGLDHLFAIHRVSGVIGLLLIAGHPIPLFLSDLMQGYRPAISAPKLVGFTTLLLLLLGAGAAIFAGRLRLKYETWKAIHWLNYLALPLGVGHSLVLGSDVAGTALKFFWITLLALYFLILPSKLWRRFRMRRHPYRVVRVTQETHDTWSLAFQGEPLAHRPGQFLIVQLVRRGRVSEPHPFTIASSPSSDVLQITVKQVGDFTATIGETQVGDAALIDAPYGVFSYTRHDAPSLVFIAGGIGITPFMSMLRDMCARGIQRKVLLIWGNKTERDIPFRQELEEMAAKLQSLRVIHVLSRQEDWPGEKGYVDTARLRRLLGEQADIAQVFLCGPPVMMDKVLQSLRELGIPRRRIHYERFALR